MTIFRRILARIYSIEHNYGDIVLAATILCCAIAVQGVLVMMPLRDHAGLAQPGSGSDAVVQLDQHRNPALTDDFDHPTSAATERHHDALALASGRPATPTTSSDVGGLPAESSQAQRRLGAPSPTTMAVAGPESPTMLVSEDDPAGTKRGNGDTQASIRTILGSAITSDQVDGTAGRSSISALSVNESRGLTPFAVSTTYGNDASPRVDSALSSRQGAISALVE